MVEWRSAVRGGSVRAGRGWRAWRAWLCGLCGVWSVAASSGSARGEAPRAGPPGPPGPPAVVNLLVSAPSAVAVSSVEAGGRFPAANLVDGDPKTAWNSRAGELTGAWLAFRVPADARVTSIKLTAGFAHVDPKRGSSLVRCQLRSVWPWLG